MLKTQYSRVINKRTSIPGEVPTIGPTENHTDGTWEDYNIYPGEFYINMEDQKVWFGWLSGSTSGVTQIYPLAGPGGGITVVGGTGISVSGASPDFNLSFNGSTTSFPGLTAGSEEVTIPVGVTTNFIVLAEAGFESALYLSSKITAIDLVTYDSAIYTIFSGIYSDGISSWTYITGILNFTGEDPAGIINSQVYVSSDANGFLVIQVGNASVNDIKVRVYWEYSIIVA